MFLNWKSLFVAGLRGFALLAKLVFTVILARMLPIEQFGQWVLIVAVVTYGIFILGAEVYNLTLRSYISDGYEAVVAKFSAQWLYFLCAYIAIVVLGAGLSFTGDSVLYAHGLVIALILIFEHFTQELHRLAFFRDHQVHANAILLIKSAGWMIPTGTYLTYAPARADLDLVLNAWLAGAVLSSLYAFAIYRQVFLGLRLRYVGNFKGKAGRGARLLTPFLIIAVALRTPFLMDRYLIERFAGAAAVGPYGYYAMFGNGVQAIFDAIILARLTPKLLSERRTHSEQLQIVVSFLKETAICWIIAIVMLSVAIPYVNGFVGKENFQEAFALLILLSFGQMIFSLASVAHYGLYAMHRDRDLTTGALVYLVLCLAFFAALIPFFGSYGAAVALILAATGLLIVRIRQTLRISAASVPSG